MAVCSLPRVLELIRRQMVQPHIHRRDAALAASQYLADALAFFTPVDSHRRGEIGSNQKLDDALLGVYTALLDYSAEVNKLREQNPAGMFIEPDCHDIAKSRLTNPKVMDLRVSPQLPISHYRSSKQV